MLNLAGVNPSAISIIPVYCPPTEADLDVVARNRAQLAIPRHRAIDEVQSINNADLIES